VRSEAHPAEGDAEEGAGGVGVVEEGDCSVDVTRA